MRLTARTAGKSPSARASVLVIVLWIALGLVTITLYFAHSMTFELRAAENASASLQSEQAIEGAARYVKYVLLNLNTNGAIPDQTLYLREAVPVGEARFWLIGRGDRQQRLANEQPFFGLIDENSKMNLNTATFSNLFFLPNMPIEFASAILDWRDTDDTISENGGAESQTYASLHPAYTCKNTNFESTEELRLVYGANMDLLVGEDINLNGVLDAGETDENRNSQVDPGLFEYLTVYGQEPTTALTNITKPGQLEPLLQTILGSSRATQIVGQIGTNRNFRSPLEFYLKSKMTVQEFNQVGPLITVSTNAYMVGRINVNTASLAVLATLPGMTMDQAQQLITYRQANLNSLNALSSIAWVVEALGQNNTDTFDLLMIKDCMTTQSYQFTADIAAVGPNGHGYRRIRFIFDTSDGTPKIVSRRDLSHLGWALGSEARQDWLLARKTR